MTSKHHWCGCTRRMPNTHSRRHTPSCWHPHVLLPENSTQRSASKHTSTQSAWLPVPEASKPPESPARKKPQMLTKKATDAHDAALGSTSTPHHTTSGKFIPEPQSCLWRSNSSNRCQPKHCGTGEKVVHVHGWGNLACLIRHNDVVQPGLKEASQISTSCSAGLAQPDHPATSTRYIRSLTCWPVVSLQAQTALHVWQVQSHCAWPHS